MRFDLTPNAAARRLRGAARADRGVALERQKARRAADKARASARVVSLAGRVLVTAAVLVGVQWIVITHPTGSPTLLLVVLALPDLLAAYVLTRTLTVTSMDVTRRDGDRR